MFPVSVSGSLKLPALRLEDVPPILDAVERRLLNVDAVDVRREDLRVTTGSRWLRLRWMASWNLLAVTGCGVIEVRPGNPAYLYYRFSTIELLIAATVIVLFVGVAGGENFDPSREAPFLAAGWIWLFGFNYLLAAIRIPIFLRRAVRRATQEPRSAHNGEVEPEGFWSR